MVLEEYKYLQIISPTNLFKNKREVIEFLNIPCSIQDLEAFLKQCEEEELYGYCILIKNKIDEKIKEQYEI